MSTLLEDEIRSQPEVIAGLLARQLPAIERIATALSLSTFDYALIVARGSSDHAALYAKYAWGALAGVPVALAAPSLVTLYQTPPRLRGALVVGISQSGQSPDIVAVLAEAHRQGRPTLAITNNPTSPLAAAADTVIALEAGVERSIAATKTYTAELFTLAALAAAWSGESARLDELRVLPQALATALIAAFSSSLPAAEWLRGAISCIVASRGYNFATAAEIALKLKELTYVSAVAYSSADLRHGPIATLEASTPLLLVMPAGAVSADLLALAHEARARGAELAVISDEPEALALAPLPLPLGLGTAVLPEWLSPVVAVVPGQVLALRLAEAKGLDPDAPRGLRKVTRTH